MNNLTPFTGNPPSPFTANTSQTAQVPFPLSPTLYSPKGSDASQRLVFLSSPENSEVNNLTDKLKTTFTSGITTPQDQEKTNKNPFFLTPLTTTPQKINTDDKIAKKLDFHLPSDSSQSFPTITLEPQQIKNHRGLAIHADDSSDEDEVNEKQAKYDITAEWNRFSVEKLQTIKDQYSVSDFTVCSSFITHTKGIGLLYNSSMIHQLYYQYKETYLASDSNDLYRAMQKEIVDIIKSTLRSIIKTNYRLSLQYDDLLTESGYVDAKFPSEELEKKAIENKIDKVVESVLEKVKPFLDKTTNDILNFRNRIWREKHTFFFEKLTKPLHKLLEHSLTSDKYIKVVYYRSPVPLPNQKEEIEVSSKFKETVINKALEVGKKEGYLRQEGDALKTPLKTAKNNYTPKKVNNLFTQKVEEIAYNKDEDSGLAVTVFKKIHNIQSLTQGALQQLIKQDQKTKYKGSPDSPVWKTAQIEENLKQYLHVSPERIQAELEILLTENLAAKLKTFSDNFKNRRTLPLQTKFEIHNATQYLANIRLSNRSQRRMIRNLNAGSLTKTTLYLPLDNKTILTNQRLWQFSNGGSALENQSITTNFGRSDTVTNGGSYQLVFKQLECIKKNYEIKINAEKYLIVTDQIIAKWIRKNIKGEDLQVKTLLYEISKSEEEQLLNIIANVTFLLFGCEAARSPASLVVNQMIIDLIIARKISWQDALVCFSELDDQTKIIEDIINKAYGLKIKTKVTRSEVLTLFEQKKQNFPLSVIRSTKCLYNDLPVEKKLKIEHALYKLQNSSYFENWKVVYEKNGLIDGGLIPMSPDGAVAAVRPLHRLYDAYMSHHYDYDGEQVGTKMETRELMEREARVVELWIEKCKNIPKDQVSLALLEKAIDDSYAQWY